MSTPYPDWVLPQPPFDTPNDDNGPFWPTLWAPPVQALAINFLRPRLAQQGIPVATRLPQPQNTADTINGFVRLESGGGKPCGDDMTFDVSVIVNSYAPNNLESTAEINCMTACAHLGNAQGQWITHPTLNRPWFIMWSRTTGLMHKQGDPLVNLVRFRAMVSWRAQGMPDPLPNDVNYKD